MPLILKYILQMALIMGLCFSCATPSKKAKESYSKSTDDDFQNIERERAIEAYRLMRMRERKAGRSKRRSNRRSYIYKKITPKQEVVKSPPPPPPEPKPLTETEITEIKQNMAYFCMKNRKNPRYSDEENCRVHTQTAFDDCKESYQENPRMNVVRCVKNKLRL